MTKLNQLMKKAPEHILREFARMCALRHVEKIKPHCSDEDYEVITTWLNTGDESIREAAYWAADSAAYWAAYWAYSAAYSAYWAAISAADSAVYSAVYSAAESAAWAARSAANSAYWAADSAYSARSAEREWQEQTLLEMLESNNE